MNLEEHLRSASEAVRESTGEVAARTSVHTSGGRRVAIAAVACVLLGLLTIGLVSRPRGDGDARAVATDREPAATSSAVDGAAGAAEPTGVEAPAPVEPLLTDGVPPDLALTSTISASDVEEASGGGETQVYAAPNVAVPGPGTDRLVVSWHWGSGGPPLAGDPVALRGGTGRITSDGSVAFEEMGLTVTVRSTTLPDSDKTDVAEALIVSADGIQPLTDAPGGLVYVGSLDWTVDARSTASVPGLGHTATYQGGQRSLTLMTAPAEPSSDAVIAWAGAMTPFDVEGVSGVISVEDGFGQAAWLQGEALVRAIAVGLDREELLAAVTGTRPAGADWGIEPPEDPGVLVADAPAGDTAELEPTSEVVASIVPEDLAITLSGEHASLDNQTWSVDEALFSDETGAVVMVSVGPVSPHFPGETVSVEGVDVVLVDKEASGARTDAQFDDGDLTVGIAVRNSDTLSVIGAVEDYLAAGELSALDEVQGLSRQGAQQTGVWDLGNAAINGPRDGSTILYTDGTGLGGRSLQVTTSPLDEDSVVEWYRLLYPERTQTVTVSGIDAYLTAPVEPWLVLRFVAAERLIELRSNGLTEAELMAAAETLRQAEAEEWNVS